MFNEIKWCPKWIIFTRSRRSPVSKSMAEIEAAEGQFIRPAGTAGPLLSGHVLLCFLLLGHFASPQGYFFVAVAFWQQGCKWDFVSWLTEKGKGKESFENFLMWWWSDQELGWQDNKLKAEPVSAPFTWFIYFIARCHNPDERVAELL